MVMGGDMIKRLWVQIPAMYTGRLRHALMDRGVPLSNND